MIIMKNAAFKFTALALVAVMALTGCTKTYTITVESNNADWGTVQGGGTYNDGETVQIAAYPAAGYYFVGWQDGVSTNPREIVVTADASYIATFSNDPNGGGSGDPDDPNNPTELGGVISSNVTWVDRGLDIDYIVTSEISLEGNALVTVEPGVCIMFSNVNAGIYVGENAGLRMVGQQDNPIILTGPTNNPNTGAWGYIRVSSNRSDNQFEYVQMINGGNGSASDEGVVLVDGTLSMKHCKVDGSLVSGVVIGSQGTLTSFEYNEIYSCAAYPLYSSYVENLCNTSTISTNNDFQDNGSNMIYVGTSDGSDDDLTFDAMPVPYYFPQGLDVGGDVTINAGAQFVVADNTNLEFRGDLIAQGTAANPIIFTGTGNSPSWNGVILDQSASSYVMNYCQILNAGVGSDWSSQSCLYIGSGVELTLTNNVFGPSGHYGVTIGYIEDWGNVTHSGNRFAQCTSGNVYIEEGGEYGGTEYESGDVLTDLP